MRLRAAVCFVVLALAADATERGITNPVTPVSPEPGRRKAVWPAPGVPRVSPDRLPRPEPVGDADSGWTAIDSKSYHLLLPAGRRLAVVFDRASESLRDTLLTDSLTPAAHEAVGVAPSWLQDALTDKFRRLPANYQDNYARLILRCPDKRYYDELCFQVAHLAPGTLTACNPQLLVDNVEWAYRIDPDLQYVDIVDHGDPLQGGNYYSATRYRTIADGESTWVEIPAEAYYWWVIMPKISDEQPLYVSGCFWREFLYTRADSGYPLLKEKLARTTLFWDGKPAAWGNGGAPFYDTLPAVAVVGRWCAYTKPYPAGSERPIQPIRIAQIHTGNCGEMQDLMCAAARTALIPCGCVLDINEDHVWCEVWWNDTLQPYADDPTTYIANPYVAYEKKYGGGKNCSGIWDWRNDGYQRSVIATYSDVCTLTVEVRDSTGRPLDGATVKISSEDWYGGSADCFYGVTDRFGRYITVLGDEQNYYLKVATRTQTLNFGRIIDSADALSGRAFFLPCTVAMRLDTLRAFPLGRPPAAEYRMVVDYSTGHEVLYGTDCYNSSGANTYALDTAPGGIDCLVLDLDNFRRYLARDSFGAFVLDENQISGAHDLLLPDGNCYAVFSNEEQANLTSFFDATVRLYRRSAEIAESRDETPAVSFLGPNPFRSRFRIRFAPGSARSSVVTISDRSGRCVRDLGRSRLSRARIAEWNGTDNAGREVPPGVYFCRIISGTTTLSRPVVYLGKLP